MDIKLEENGGGKILPTERLSLSCCSKMGCDNVFTRTKGQTAYEERTGIMNGIYFCEDCNTAEHCDDPNEVDLGAGYICFFHYYFLNC